MMRFCACLLGLSFIAPTAYADEAFTICDGHSNWQCVVDGDTIHMNGLVVRLIDIDAPEIFSPKCEGELKLGQVARDRLLELLNASPVKLQAVGSRDRDVYGRKLRLVMIDGISAGALLVQEGLAAKWQGHHHRWCG